MAEKIDYSKGIYDAKQLGTPKLLILGAQHMFAMFGATVLVPLLTGLSVSTTLLCAGLGTRAAPTWRSPRTKRQIFPSILHFPLKSAILLRISKGGCSV